MTHFSECLRTDNRINIPELISEGYNSTDVSLKIFEDYGMYFHYKGKRFLIVDWEFTFLLTCRKADKPIEWKTFGYRQEIIEGNLAFFATGQIEYYGENVEINIIFKTKDELSVHCEFKSKLNLKGGVTIT